jgi:hypothetical protein
MVNTIMSDTPLQGPAGLSVVKVRDTVPTVISSEEGVYVAARRAVLSKVPEPEVLQAELDAPPPLVPDNV